MLASTMKSLALSEEAIDDGALAVSELVTNAFLHAGVPARFEPIRVPELWLWARTHPRKELVVTVFDTHRDKLPRLGTGDLLDSHGKGLGIVAALSSAWGCHPSRSQLGEPPIPGKATWFALPLPPSWPCSGRSLHSVVAAQRLLMLLAVRGFEGKRHSDLTGTSVVMAGGLKVHIDQDAFAWHNDDGTPCRHPLLDLQETAEHIICSLEAAGMARS
ncbi:ATP-binding protein [Actinomadura hibisca]|uniref:ATP-binding protein n=1 Tax=Actinomadura hibisca TaxID=68565 RepID=UPI000832687F|nr:ATP-binding protein [Actinomadura hibisca]